MPDSPTTPPPPGENVILTYRRETFTVPSGLTVRDAIRQCGLDPDALLAVRQGELIEGDVILQPGDRVKLLGMSAGG